MAVQRSTRQVQHGVMALMLGKIGMVKQYVDSANSWRDRLQRMIGIKPGEFERDSKWAGCRRCEQSDLRGIEQRELIGGETPGRIDHARQRGGGCCDRGHAMISKP